MLVNPRSGDGLAQGFLTDYPTLNTYEELNCELRIYNVREKQECQKCYEDLEAEIKLNDKTTKKIVAIAGGDGSLGTTIKSMRSSTVLEKALSRGKIYVATLPYGTGNDGP
jgi:diacylglycerol kinase family enzyme